MFAAMTTKLIFSTITGVVLLASSSQANAAADVKVQLQGPASPFVYVSNTYSATVSNIGNQTATGVTLQIELPVTTTSPQIYILGELSGLQSGCSVVNRVLNCALGDIRKGRSVVKTFNFKFPQAAKTLSLKGTVASTSPDNSTGNNVSTLTPALNHPDLEIAGDQEVLNSHCTGTTLTSYFECLTAPTSISQHGATFHDDGSISFADFPEYSGEWQQTNSIKELTFQYYENGLTVAEFVGWAVDGNCFEGMTTFVPASNYVSPYRVCLQ